MQFVPRRQIAAKMHIRMHHARTALDAPPTESLPVDPSLAIEAHAFTPQQCALLVVSARWAPTDFPLRVDHSMPGDVPRAGAERPSDRTRSPGHAQGAGDHPVAYDTTARDRPHNRINAAEDRGSSRLAHGSRAASHEFVDRGVRVSPPHVGRRACFRAFPIGGRGIPSESTPDPCIAASSARFGESPHGPHSPITAELRRRRTSRVSFLQTRRTSATLQACAMHPRGRWGGSPSKISVRGPLHEPPYEHSASHWRRKGGHQYSVIASGEHAGQRAGRIPAEAVGHQPFPAESSGEVAANLSPKGHERGVDRRAWSPAGSRSRGRQWPRHRRSCEKSSSQNSWARRTCWPRCSRSRSSTRRIFPETVLGSSKNSRRRMRL